MDLNKKHSKYFSFTLCLSIILIAVLTFDFYSAFIKNDFKVEEQAPCDPSTNSCFVSDCQTDDPTCDASTTYEKIFVQSNFAGTDHDTLSCLPGSSLCKIVTCRARYNRSWREMLSI